MRRKLKAHLISLPRWFAAPFFGSFFLLGSVMAGGINWHAWLMLVAGLLLMASGHAMNSFLDYAWTGLDKGEKENRSAEKSYTGGQNLIENKVVSLKEVLVNAIICALLGIIPMYLISNGKPNEIPLVILYLCGFGIPWMYSWGKFTTWAHELSLGLGVGPISVLMGMYAVNPHPPVIHGLLVSVPAMIILSFLGLALDEWPDAEANLKKGVKSMPYMVWKYSEWILGYGNTYSSDRSKACEWYKSFGLLRWYCLAWLMFLCIYHVLLICLGILAPLTALAMLVVPVCIGLLVVMEKNFQKTMIVLIAVSALYPILLLVGQIIK